DVLGHREVREDPAVLRREGEPAPGDLVGAPPVDVLVAQPDPAGARAQEAHLALPHLERDAAEDVARLDEDVDGLDAQHRVPPLTARPARSPCPPPARRPGWRRGSRRRAPGPGAAR